MASLFIDVEARFAKFQDSLDQVSRDVQRQVRGMERAFSAIGTSIAGIGAALGVGAVGTAVAGIVSSLADLDDAAEKSGASVESLSSLLNTLAPTGVTLEQISNVTAKLTKAMAGADEETSRAAEAFKALGINTRDAEGNLRPVDDVLTELARSLSQYEDGTNKTALAQALLTKSGAEYLPLLKDLATRQRESATVTTEQAAAAEKLANAWRTLGVETTKLAQQLAGPLLTSLAEIINRFNAAGTSSENFYNRLRLALTPNREIGRLESDVASLTKELERLEDLQKSDKLDGYLRKRIGAELEDVTKRLDRARRALADAQPVRSMIEQQFDGVTPGGAPPKLPPAPKLSADDDKRPKQTVSDAERLTRALEDQVFTSLKLSEVDKLRADIARGRVAFETEAQQNRALNAAAQVDSIRSITQAAEDESKAALRRIAAYEDLERTQGAANESAEKSIRDQIEAWKDLVEPTRQYQRELDRINAALEQNRITSAQADAFRRATLDGLIGSLDKTKDATEDTTNIAKELGATFTSAFEDAILNGKKFSEVLKAIANDITRLVLRVTVTDPFSKFLLGDKLDGKSGAIADLIPGLARVFSGGGDGLGAELNPYVGLPKAATVGKDAGANASVVNYVNVSGEVSRADVYNAVALAEARTRDVILGSFSRNGAFAKV